MTTLSEVKDIATIAGVVVGAGSLLFAALNVYITARTNRAKFWLELRSAFAKHDEVHRALRNGGKWTGNGEPSSPDEYFQIESYMGLFEHCEIMISQRLLDEKTFREIYRYRLVNLLANRWVREVKIRRNASGWKRFIELLDRFQVDYEHPKTGNT